jgi:hypothetical protein
MSISVLFVIFFAFIHFFSFFCVVIKHVVLFFTRVAHHLIHLFYLYVSFSVPPFFVVDNQAFGSDKGKSLAKNQSDIIYLDDLLVDKLGAGVARNYSSGVENCKQVVNNVKGNYLLVFFLLYHFFSIIACFIIFSVT